MNTVEHAGLVVWITGLSAAGKTTLALEVVKKIRVGGEKVIHLDGDQLREVFATNSNNTQRHDRSSRLQLAYQYSALCKTLSDQGVHVVISTISMFSEIYTWNKENIQNYLEVFLDVPLNIREQRDPKGIYERFRNNQVEHVAGLDLAIDLPTQPALVLRNAHELSLDYQLKQVFELINERNKT